MITKCDAGPRWAEILGLVLGIVFLVAGISRQFPVPFDVELWASWGVPSWMRSAAGVGELTAGLLSVLQRTRPIGAVGIFTVMTGAGTMHAALGHSMAVAALVNGVPAALALAVAWALRRRRRRYERPHLIGPAARHARGHRRPSRG